MYHTYLQGSICIFTHTGFNLLSGGWGLGQCSTNFRWYRYITWVKKLGFDWLLITYWCFTACLFVRVYRHSLSVFENLQQLHILDLSIEWFLTSFFGPPHWANLVVKTSGNFILVWIFFQGHLVRTFCNLDHRLLQEAMLKNTFFGFPNLWSLIWGSSLICSLLLLIFGLFKEELVPVQVLNSFYMKLVEDPLGALPSCCHLTQILV